MSSAAPKDGFRQEFGPWGLIAGASEGLGAAYAWQAAARGLNLVLVARRAGKLDELAAQIRDRHAVDTRTVSANLGSGEILDQLRSYTDDIDVGLVVYNAAAIQYGLFLAGDMAEHLEVIDVNCRGPVLLCHHFGSRMVKRGKGGIILMTSAMALAGTSHLAAYSASKAFCLNLGEALWREWRPRGVHVLSLVAGLTATPGAASIGVDLDKAEVPAMEPADVAREALDRLGEGPSWIAGERNREALEEARSLTRRALGKLLGEANAKLHGLRT